jgi:hypothetical protein
MRFRSALMTVIAFSLLLTACHRGGTTSNSPTKSPLKRARMSGQYLVTLKVTSQKGLLSPISGGSAVWTFKPKCATGPCKVKWSASPSGSKGTLRNTGIYYTGTFSTPANIRSCTGAATKEHVVLHIHVTAAATVNGVIIATKIAGTMSEKNSTHGCKASKATWSVSGFSQSS